MLKTATAREKVLKGFIKKNGTCGSSGRKMWRVK
jgi:hypothetical protein